MTHYGNDDQSCRNILLVLIFEFHYSVTSKYKGLLILHYNFNQKDQ